MNVPASKTARLSAALRPLAALALVSFAVSGCGKLVPSMHFSGADAAADAPRANADGGSRPDTRAMDAPVDVAAEVGPSDAGPADARDGGADTVTVVDASTTGRAGARAVSARAQIVS